MTMREFRVLCDECQKEVTLLLDPAHFDRWHDGMMIQDALPYLTAGERELLISGTCDECFKQLFPPEEIA